jgi:hypothetical protein
MDSFDVTFDYKGKKYTITLIENKKAVSEDLVSKLKSIIGKNFN